MGVQVKAHMDLFDSNAQAPAIPGLTYIANYITLKEELNIIGHIDNEPWLNDLKRRVQHYGFKYDYRERSISNESKLTELPKWVAYQSQRLLSEAIFAKTPDQVIVNEYQPGQGISPHIDCIPCFDKIIASLSLGSACVIEFINPDTKQNIPMLLEARSLLVLTGDARYKWQHTIPQRRADKFNGLVYIRQRRLSLTFRNVLLASHI